MYIYSSPFCRGGGVKHICGQRALRISGRAVCRDLVCFLMGVGGGGWPTHWSRLFQCFNRPLQIRIENSVISGLVFGTGYRLVFKICFKYNQKFQHKIRTYTDSKTKSTLCISTQFKIDNTVFAVVLKPQGTWQQ